MTNDKFQSAEIMLEVNKAAITNTHAQSSGSVASLTHGQSGRNVLIHASYSHEGANYNSFAVADIADLVDNP